jgi:hypothetical protein
MDEENENMEQDEGGAGADNALRIYDRINLLTIRKTVRMLCELDPDEIEDFVKKYSSVIIYLLNILDQKLSSELLARLTESSILYIIEEEFRTILMQKIDQVSGEIEILVDLSNYLEIVNREAQGGATIDPSTRSVLELLWEGKRRDEKQRFAYLDSVSAERKRSIGKLMIQHNIHTALGVLIYASELIVYGLLDMIAVSRPESLQVIPVDIIRMRLKKNYDLYREEAIFGHLPVELAALISSTTEVYSKFRAEFDTIARVRMSNISASDKRRHVLDTIFSIVQRLDPGMKEIMLSELVSRNYITDEDVNMIKSIAENG